jgi:hypothetical protein
LRVRWKVAQIEKASAAAPSVAAPEWDHSMIL